MVQTKIKYIFWIAWMLNKLVLSKLFWRLLPFLFEDVGLLYGVWEIDTDTEG